MKKKVEEAKKPIKLKNKEGKGWKKIQKNFDTRYKRKHTICEKDERVTMSMMLLVCSFFKAESACSGVLTGGILSIES